MGIYELKNLVTGNTARVHAHSYNAACLYFELTYPYFGVKTPLIITRIGDAK